VTFEFEYLGKFEFIFEKILSYETGSQMGSIFERKKFGQKSHASVMNDLILWLKCSTSFGALISQQRNRFSIASHSISIMAHSGQSD
jgi:hypothetical protein